MVLTEEGIAVVEGDAWLSRQIRDERRLDVEHARGLINLMRVFIPVGGTVCDAGACLGDHTIGYADLVGPSGRVHAFEPNAPAFECLTYNMRDRPWVTCHQIALANCISRCIMGPELDHVDNLGMVTIYKETPDGPVALSTLDAIAEDWPRLDFLKVDVEGLEPALLTGARETIARWKPPILIELNRGALANHGVTPSHVLQRLDGFGYVFMPVCYDWATTDPWVRMSETEVDVVCVHKEDARSDGFLQLS